MNDIQAKYEAYNQSFEQKRRIGILLNTMIKYLCILLVLCFGFIFFLRKCSKTEPIKVNTNNIRDSIADFSLRIEQKQVKKDSVVKEIVKYKYLLGKETKYFIHDTIRIDSLIYLSQKQDTIIKIDSTLIVDFKSKITQYQKLDTIQQKQIDSLISQPKGRFKAFCTGVGIGFIIGSVVK